MWSGKVEEHLAYDSVDIKFKRKNWPAVIEVRIVVTLGDSDPKELNKAFFFL